MSVGTRDATEAVVAVTGDVYVARAGTPLPSLVRTPLHSSFYRIGLVTDDGVSLAVAPTIDQQDAWQEANPVRLDLAEQRIALTFDMMQWNAETVVWAFGGNGQVVEFAPGQWRYDFPDSNDSTVDERSIVVDWEDGDRVFRLVFARGTVLGGLTTTLRRSSLALLPVGFDVLAVDGTGSPGYLFLSDEGPLAPPPPPTLITICRSGTTMQVPPDQIQPGDTLGPCTPPPPPPGGGTMGDGLMGDGTMGDA